MRPIPARWSLARSLARTGWAATLTVSVIAVGKAAPAMAGAAWHALGASRARRSRDRTDRDQRSGRRFELIVGEHPQPGPGSLSGRRECAGNGAQLCPRDERLLVLLSGGASSLMAAPAPGITLEEKRQATAVLLRAGADIYALNTVRKHLSAIKGGRLARSPRPATVARS